MSTDVLKVRLIDGDADELGDIHDDFRYIGQKKDGTKCSQQINKTKLKRARQALRDMSTIDITASDFHDSIKELSERFLCTKSKHRFTQHTRIRTEWAEDLRNHIEETNL